MTLNKNFLLPGSISVKEVIARPVGNKLVLASFSSVNLQLLFKQYYSNYDLFRFHLHYVEGGFQSWGTHIVTRGASCMIMPRP